MINNKKLFLRFLKENNIKENFINNFHFSMRNETVDHYINRYSNNNDIIKNIFFNPFQWHFTQEGYHFWSKIHLKWRNIIAQIY